LWVEVVRRGLLGEVRLVSSGGAGYRYHATAVARQLFGRRRGLTALGMRAFTHIDLGRGVEREPLYVGSVDVDGGGIFQISASEVFYSSGSGWSPLGWSILGDRGGVSVHNELSLAGAGGIRRHSVEWVSGPGEREDVVRALRVTGGPDIQVVSALPDFEASDDLQAVGLCLLDWLGRLDDRASATAWSPRDAFLDLAWIGAVERSAMLGGARLNIRPPREPLSTE
jgi:hypothetical protein